MSLQRVGKSIIIIFMKYDLKTKVIEWNICNTKVYLYTKSTKKMRHQT